MRKHVSAVATLNCSGCYPDLVSHSNRCALYNTAFKYDWVIPGTVLLNKIFVQIQCATLENVIRCGWKSGYLTISTWIFPQGFWQIISCSRGKTSNALVSWLMTKVPPLPLRCPDLPSYSHKLCHPRWPKPQLSDPPLFLPREVTQGLIPLPQVETISSLIPLSFQLLFEWWTGCSSHYGRQPDRSKVTKRNNPFMKPSSPAEVKLAQGRSACRLCPFSASAKDCTALFTLLPWKAHSWLIALELAVRHECERREKPDECLNGAPVWMPDALHPICSQFSLLCLLFPFLLLLSQSSMLPLTLCVGNWICLLTPCFLKMISV